MQSPEGEGGEGAWEEARSSQDDKDTKLQEELDKEAENRGATVPPEVYYVRNQIPM